MDMLPKSNDVSKWWRWLERYFSVIRLWKPSPARALAAWPKLQKAKVRTGGGRSACCQWRSIWWSSKEAADVQVHGTHWNPFTGSEADQVSRPLSIHIWRVMAVWWSSHCLENWKYNPHVEEGKKRRCRDLKATQSHLCAWQDHGADHPEDPTKAYGR